MLYVLWMRKIAVAYVRQFGNDNENDEWGWEFPCDSEWELPNTERGAFDIFQD